MRLGQVLKRSVVAALIAPLLLGSCRSQRGSGCSCSSGGQGGSAPFVVSEADREAMARRAAEVEAQRTAAREAESLRVENEAKAKRRRIFDAVVVGDGFDLVPQAGSAWAASVTIGGRDSERLSFEGTARLRLKMPFEDVPVNGSVDAKGQLVIEGLAAAASPVIIDGVSPTGSVSGSGYTVEAWTKEKREKRAAQDSRMTELSKQEFVPTTTLLEGAEKVKTIASLTMLFPRAQIRTGKYDEAREWFDGKFETVFGRSGNLDLSVAARYTEPVAASGVLLTYAGFGDPVVGVTMRINGGEPIGIRLPYADARINFGRTVTVCELLIECRAGFASFGEVALIAPEKQSP